LLFLLRTVRGPGALGRWSEAVCHVPLGGPATFPLSTGGVFPSFFWFVLATRGSVVLDLCSGVTGLGARWSSGTSLNSLRMRGSKDSTVFFLLLCQVSMGETQSSVKILPRLLCSGSTGNVGVGLWSERSYSHFRRIHTSGMGSLFSWYPSHPACSLRSYSHTPCMGSLFSRYPSCQSWSLCVFSHTPCVGSLFSLYPSCPAWSLRSSSHTPCMVSLFLRYPSLPLLSLCGFSHTPCVGSLFSLYPSCPAWSLRSSSHTPCIVSLFLRYPSRPLLSLRGFSHTPCVGSLFSGGMVTAQVTGIEM